jgi:hypothetical protein
MANALPKGEHRVDFHGGELDAAEPGGTTYANYF